MFDFSNFYDKIADQLPDNCVVVECGVANGESSLYLAKRLYELGKTFTLYMVDDCSYGGYNQLIDIYENIVNSGLGRSIKVIPLDSVKASEKFNGHSIDFVFLDSSHLYEPTKHEIVAWYDKVKDDGVLAGHDVITHEEVAKAVSELIPEYITRPEITTPGNEQTFEPEKLLNIEDTDNGYGVFWIKKRFYWQPKL